MCLYSIRRVGTFMWTLHAVIYSLRNKLYFSVSVEACIGSNDVLRKLRVVRGTEYTSGG